MRAMTGTAVLAAAMLIAAGCGGDGGTKVGSGAAAKPAPGAAKADKLAAKAEVADAKADKKEDDHSGWWCGEHGIPEEECSMCSAKVAKDCKAKGDWCEKHDRAMSQCFVCRPERREFYAAKHRAKYGKEPPAVEEDEKKEPGKKG